MIFKKLKNIGRAIRLLFNFHTNTTKILLETFVIFNKAKKNEITSYAGEFEHLEKITNKLNINNGYIVDIAAGDGYKQSCTLGYFKKGWKGLCVEMDPVKFSKLSFLYHQFPKVNLSKNIITPINVDLVLDSNNIPKNFDLLNLDIDSYDLELMKKIFEKNFSPKIISMEINEKIPPPIFFSTKFDQNDSWEKSDHFYGCSITAAADLMVKNGYIIESLQYNNLICIKKDLLNSDFIKKDIKIIYEEGYKNKPNRKKLFPWNKDVDCLLNMENNEALDFINKYFFEYKDKYTIYIKED